MAQQNFTSIENLIEKQKEAMVSRPKEVEPMVVPKETKEIGVLQSCIENGRGKL